MKLNRCFVIITLLLLVITQHVSAQTDERNSKFALGLSFTPNYCYRTILRVENEVYPFKPIVDFFNEHDAHGICYSAGIGSIYSFTKKLKVEVNLLFAKNMYKTSNIPLSNPFGDIIGTCNFNNIYTYFDGELKVDYLIGNKRKLKYLMSAGISPMFFNYFQIKYIFYYNDGCVEKEKSDKNRTLCESLTFSYIIETGASYELNDKFDIKLCVKYKQFFTSTGEFVIGKYLYSFGLNTGVYYKF